MTDTNDTHAVAVGVRMTDIQRWYPCIGHDPDPYVEMTESAEGVHVRYADHVAVVAALTAERGQARALALDDAARVCERIAAGSSRPEAWLGAATVIRSLVSAKGKP